jgi:hypothetical protein
MLANFCINRDHKISFKIITLPCREGLGLKFSALLEFFISCASVMVYIFYWWWRSDALALETFSYACGGP